MQTDELRSSHTVSRPRVNSRVPGRRANGSGLQELRKRGGQSGRSTGQRNASSVSFAEPVGDGQSERNVVPWTNANASPSGSQVSMIETRRQV